MGESKGAQGSNERENDAEYFTLDYPCKSSVHTSATSFLSGF